MAVLKIIFIVAFWTTVSADFPQFPYGHPLHPKTCHDASRYCNYYSANGYCSARPLYMETQCRSTCGLCDQLSFAKNPDDETIFPTQCSESCGHLVQPIQKNESPKFRVLEGEEADIQTSPWTVRVLSKYPSCEGRLGDQNCTGVLIGKRWALSAAHCVTFLSTECTPGVVETTISLSPENVTVEVGINSNEHKLVGVESIYWNNLYDAMTFNHVTQRDVVLLKLKESLKFSASVGWACVPKTRLGVENEPSATVAGYGRMNKKGWFGSVSEVASPTLRKDTVKVNLFWDVGFYSSESAEKQFSDGDSGSGLVVQNGTVHSVYGILSSRTTETSPYETYFVALRIYCQRLETDTGSEVKCIDPQTIPQTCVNDALTKAKFE